MNWIHELKVADELEMLRRQTVEQLRATATLLIQQKGPEFWRQLLKELQCAIDALPEIGIRGQMSVSGNAIGGEQHCRVQVAAIGPVASLTYTDLFYTLGAPIIRCMNAEGQNFCLTFAIPEDSNAVGIVSENQFTPVNAEKTAEIIAKRMVDKIRAFRVLR